MSETSDSPPAKLTSLINAIPNLSAPSNTKFRNLESWFAELVGDSPSQVYCVYASKPGNIDVRLRQPGSLKTKKSLGVALVPKDAHLDRYVQPASKLVGQGQIYDAVALCARVSNGAWSLVHLVEPEGGRYTQRLREAFPDLKSSLPTATSPMASGLTATGGGIKGADSITSSLSTTAAREDAPKIWLEITNRPDVGSDLIAPKSQDHWSWSLLTRVDAGDVVFHYSTQEEGIVGVSRASGKASVSEIEWPERRPAWKILLSEYRELSTPVTLSDLREKEPEIRDIRLRLKESDQARYFPFSLSDKQALRPQQAYLTRFPGEMLALFPQLAEGVPPPKARTLMHPTGSDLTEFADLFAEFLDSYWRKEVGRDHAEAYRQARREAENNFDSLKRAYEAGEGLGDAVLLKLLPHRDTSGNRSRGAWIHPAASITKDARQLFEGAGWVLSSDWSVVSKRLFEFVSRCSSDPGTLTRECEDFAAFPSAKGFQSGMLSPILSALRPEDYLVLNRKSLTAINHWSNTSFSSQLVEYPSANATGLQLLSRAEAVLATADEKDARPCDLFDCFCHWLWAEKGFWDDIGEESAAERIQYWKISPGFRGEQWDAWRSGNYAAIGWTDLGDLSGLSKQEFDLRQEEAVRQNPKWSKSGLLQCWKFRGIPEGSFVLANRGTSEVLGVGQVTGPYYFVPDSEFGHRLPIRWLETKPRAIDQPGWRRTLVRLDRDEFEEITGFEFGSRSTMQDEGRPFLLQGALDRQPEYTLADFNTETAFPSSTAQIWLSILARKKQVVFQGPPGTGKTYIAIRLAQLLVSGSKGVMDLVQFHPSYSYEDFIQGIKPEVVGQGLAYRLEPGRFLTFCERARLVPESPCVLIIDELNRANLARVFGELMYLLEYRKEAIPLAQGGTPFRVPDNVHVIGTMNTADRSIARMDYALRRRFSFIRLRPEYRILRQHLERSGLPSAELPATLEEINRLIDDPNYELGIAYFLRGPKLPGEIRQIWEGEIEPYLEEFFYDQPAKVEEWRWESLIGRRLKSWAP